MISGFPDPENLKIRDPGESRSRKIPGNPDPDPVCPKPNVNSIFSLPIHGKIYLYADDVCIIYGEENDKILKEKMEYDLNVLNIYFQNNFLKMNAKKTKYMILKSRMQIDIFVGSGITIQLDGKIIERVDSFTYLGLIIDEKLSFIEHTNMIKNKITSMTYVIKRIRNTISNETALQ